MTTEIALPADVIAALEANRKIDAIKLLRTQRGIGLKEAKEQVEAYLAQNPASSHLQAPKSESGIGRILLLVIGVSIIYGLYRFFS